MTMRQFTEHVIAVANENTSGISNLQLQKILYFAIGDYIKEHGRDFTIEELYTEPFQAWTYGPVVESEYHRYKKYGRYFIRESGSRFDEYSDFDMHIKKYLKWSVTELVEKSHDHPTWYENRQSILEKELIEYRLEDLENDFTKAN
jgi:uncharacterized phage-associated protein